MSKAIQEKLFEINEKFDNFLIEENLIKTDIREKTSEISINIDKFSSLLDKFNGIFEQKGGNIEETIKTINENISKGMAIINTKSQEAMDKINELKSKIKNTILGCDKTKIKNMVDNLMKTLKSIIIDITKITHYIGTKNINMLTTQDKITIVHTKYEGLKELNIFLNIIIPISPIVEKLRNPEDKKDAIFIEKIKILYKKIINSVTKEKFIFYIDNTSHPPINIMETLKNARNIINPNERLKTDNTYKQITNVANDIANDAISICNDLSLTYDKIII
jgi:hypothetical protein